MRRLFLIMMLCISVPAFGFAQAPENDLTAIEAPDGRTVSELSVDWWQWLTSAPDVTDPLDDEAGDFCGYGQKGDVWFLSGSYSMDKVVRHCKVPAGKYVFFPVINMMLWDEADGQSCEELKGDVTAAIDTARELMVVVDGTKLEAIKQYRSAVEQCFAISGDEAYYASDGYWILLKPLKAGKHVIHSMGELGDGGEAAEDFTQDIEYVLDVQ